MFRTIRKLAIVRETEGVTAIEYAFIAALIAVVIIAGMLVAGGALGTLWSSLGDCVGSYGTVCNL